MNWLERLDNVKLEITTGDGRKFAPLWKDAKKNIRYNTEGFDFVDVEGTFVERKKQSGNQFPILFYFHGEDCIEEARSFEYSARDSRPWVIKHPFYDAILVQPLSLEIDNSVYNISKITGVVWETINYKYPQTELNVQITIIQTKSSIDLRAEEVFESKIQIPAPSSINLAGLNVDFLDKNYSIFTDVFEKIEVLKDLTRKASAAAQNLISEPLHYMQSVKNLINFPFLIKQTIEFKINKLIESYDEIKTMLIGDGSDDAYNMLESMSFMLLSEACVLSVSPEADDYSTRQGVTDIIGRIVDLYDTIIESFDDAGYDYDSDLALEADNIFNLTVASLYDIAYNSKQKRDIALEADSNVVLLAHRFYGPGDDNMDTFITQNNISFDELLQIKKGRNITWYV